MRTFALILVPLLLVGCGREPAAPMPDFAAVGPANIPEQAAPLRIVNQRYFMDHESFRFCDGSLAWGDITWHEVIVELETPSGQHIWHIQLNMVGSARAYGEDGTEYIVQQVNTSFHESPSPNHDSRWRLQIMLISRGAGQNARYTTGYWNGSYWQMCRG